MFTPSQICVYGLTFIAGYTAYRQYIKKNPWPWVVAYWVLLTIKNLCDWVALNG